MGEPVYVKESLPLATSRLTAAGSPNNSTAQRAQGPARRKALRALEANQSLNYLWRPPLGARAPKTEFLRLNQRKHTTHALQRTTGTTPTSVTHWEFTGGVWEVACSSGALGEAGMGPGHRQNGGQRQEPHLDATEGHFVGRGVPMAGYLITPVLVFWT